MIIVIDKDDAILRFFSLVRSKRFQQFIRLFHCQENHKSVNHTTNTIVKEIGAVSTVYHYYQELKDLGFHLMEATESTSEVPIESMDSHKSTMGMINLGPEVQEVEADRTSRGLPVEIQVQLEFPDHDLAIDNGRLPTLDLGNIFWNHENLLKIAEFVTSTPRLEFIKLCKSLQISGIRLPKYNNVKMQYPYFTNQIFREVTANAGFTYNKYYSISRLLSSSLFTQVGQTELPIKIKMIASGLKFTLIANSDLVLGESD